MDLCEGSASAPTECHGYLSSRLDQIQIKHEVLGRPITLHAAPEAGILHPLTTAKVVCSFTWLQSSFHSSCPHDLWYRNYCSAGVA